MAFAYGTMQNFVENVLQAHIVSLRDLIDSRLTWELGLLNDDLDIFKKQVNDRFNQMESDFNDKLEALRLSLTTKINSDIASLDLKLTTQLNAVAADLSAHIRDKTNPHKVVLNQFATISNLPAGYSPFATWVQVIV